MAQGKQPAPQHAQGTQGSLSTKGSLLDPGGRFNIGEIDPARFPIFPALYLASDIRTALAELLGREGPENSLSAEELALTKPTSITIIFVSGRMESVLDVRDGKNLTHFIALIKDFRVSSKLVLNARRLSLQVKLVRATSELVKELASPRREWPMVYDVPAAPQIFGRMVFDAGIEGILVPQ
ncbi:MAG TPA: RES domain-containing protein [Candidatus Acidoferrum sp.]